MSKQAREPNVVLAELMGDEEQICESLRGNWNPDTDPNAMREVWKVLKERGLWDEFLFQFRLQLWYQDKLKLANCGDHQHYGFALIHDFLNDLSGQVQAAIKVLKG